MPAMTDAVRAISSSLQPAFTFELPKILLADDQVFTHFSSLNPAVGAKVVAMRSLESTNARFVAPQKILENFSVWIPVRAVRQHDLAVAIESKQSVKGVDRRFARPEGRVRLFDLLDFCVLHDADATPVARQPFEEMVSLHVTVIIGPRYIGRIQIHETHSGGLEAEHISAFD